MPAWQVILDSGYVSVAAGSGWRDLDADRAELDVSTIRGAADYARLCDRYGAPDGADGVRVAWDRVAADHHAVHLTLGGLLLTQGRPVETRHGTAVLRGWDCESTAWLRLPRSARITSVPH
ncbi:hypothetical protein [Streptomyces sp. NPDC089919]|uniref:hypothetical protein n=1 Tax=Streptomyces sp. NPDC089919 TaxID=3155188 RepID=UPI00343DAFF1